tara:strand:+ start:116 stop:352 length:237 start_codon:yes stop_codon:yes gene_type:complete
VFQLFQLLHQQVVGLEAAVLLVAVMVQMVVQEVEVDIQVAEVQVIHLLQLPHKVLLVVIQLMQEEEEAAVAVALLKLE